MKKIVTRSLISLISLTIAILAMYLYYSNNTDMFVIQLMISAAVVLALFSGYLRLKD